MMLSRPWGEGRLRGINIIRAGVKLEAGNMSCHPLPPDTCIQYTYIASDCCIENTSQGKMPRRSHWSFYHIGSLIGSVHRAIPLPLLSLSLSASDLITPRGKVNIGCIKKVTGDLNYTIITLPGHYSVSMAGSDGRCWPAVIMTTLPSSECEAGQGRG